ncbi:thaumatin-like protein 1b, partial [Tanacetum coccineum]
MNHIIFTLIITITLIIIPNTQQTSFKITNKCRHTIWPGILTGADRPVLNPTGFVLKSGQSRTLRVPVSWSGRIWGRTDCRVDGSGRLVCVTADCGSGKVACEGRGAEPPATLAEFTLNGDQGLDFYDVSLVDG